MPPAAAAAALPYVGIAGAGASLLPAIFGGNDDYQQASPNAQAMSQEELAEAQRIAALNKQMQGIFQGRYDNAAGNAEALDLKKIFGGEYAGLAGEMLPGRFQQDALAGLMGLTGNVGGGTVNAEANRGFLNDQANTEAAGGAVNTLVNELLDFADQRLGGGDGNYTSPGYGAPQMSEGIQRLPEPDPSAAYPLPKFV